MGVAVDDSGADFRHDAVLLPALAFHTGLSGTDEARMSQCLTVLRLALRHGLAGLHQLILLHVDHGVHLHQAVLAL